MSAPTPAPGDDRPREGYYPDPSIPGYVRYWNGASWVPGTSRPAPKDGEPLTPPPGVRPAAPAVEETGPHFFDEDPDPAPSAQDGSGAWAAGGGSGPRPPGYGDERAGRAGTGGQGAGQSGAAGSGPGQAGAGGRGAGLGGHGTGQSGAGGAGDGRTAWGADPRVPAQAPDRSAGKAGRPEGTAPAAEGDTPDPGGTFLFRRPVPGPAAVRDEGTMTFRPVPGQGRPGAQPGSGPQAPGSPASGPEAGAGAGFGPHGPGHGAGFGAQAAGADADAGAGAGFGAQAPAPGPGFAGPASGSGAAAAGFGPQGPVGTPAPSSATPAPAPSASAGPGFGAGKAAAARAAQAPQAPSGQAAGAPSVPAQGAAPATPVTSGPGGGQASWAQQVHQLAGGGDEQPVAPWKPPVEDLFQAAARRQAAARPAGVGKRFAARLIDTLVVGAVTAAAAVPFGTRAADHIQQKIDAARLSGREVTVWLLDGTTATSLGIVLAVLLLFGVVYEVLPTARWGRTLGKKLLGLQVRDIEGHEPPAFGPALRRWLVYSVPGLLGIGIVGVLWCLFDRPWHQCWHDKAARTFVAG
ncbi:RDD family protein [Streptomyces sp. NPDC046759]|uniref:RDD family protein n=1 Tax=Streptomyces sp. NPDC046759 TaxID=3155019 RepID=UPI0033EAE39B